MVLQKKSRYTRFWIRLLFWVHVPFPLIWFSLFLIPSSIWPERSLVHLGYALFIICVQFLWGVLAHHRLVLICPMTAWMQKLRGFEYTDPRNYAHGCIEEGLREMKIPLQGKTLSAVLVLSFVVIVVNYLRYLF